MSKRSLSKKHLKQIRQAKHETHLLKRFYATINTKYALRKIDALIKFSQFGHEVQASETRAKFNRMKFFIHLEKCLVCGAKAQHRHHIIPISRGGSNRPRNIIGLCKECHTAVHPWMIGETEVPIITQIDPLTEAFFRTLSI